MITNIELELINKCTLRCYNCYRQRDNKYLPNQMIKIGTIIDFLEKLNYTGGVDLIGNVSEPTLYPDLFPLLEYLNSRNIKVVISTNASTHTPKWWAELAAYIKNDSEVWFCIDGSTQEIHSWYRRGSKLQMVLDNHAAFKQGNPKAISICHRIDFVKTQHDKDNVIALAKENGFDRVETSIPFNSPNSEFNGRYSYLINGYKNSAVHECISIRDKKIFISCDEKIYLCSNITVGGVDINDFDINSFFNNNDINDNIICKHDCNIFQCIILPSLLKG